MGLVKSMTDEMTKEIGNKTREFYEFVLPPVDMHIDKDQLTIIVDMPGFEKKDIKLSLEDRILSIQACKQTPEESDRKIICNQRPNIVDKKLRLPVTLEEGNSLGPAKYEDGILTVMIPVQKNVQDIKIE
ncbi:MAG: Hsp20/alpha crystallin family protein [Thaumarchaeota archaeon]|nr:Hsp20/alpha crystallin family protein [Nitrososphaerota archaeon]